MNANVRAMSSPLLEVSGVTLQYKTPRHLVTATYRVDFSVHQSDRYVMLLANHALHKGDVHGGYVPDDDLDAMRAATQKITDYLRANGLPL